MKLTFGKHKGKTINDLINEGEHGYVVWLYHNVKSVEIPIGKYDYCKRKHTIEMLEYQAKFESEHGDAGYRD